MGKCDSLKPALHFPRNPVPLQPFSGSSFDSAGRMLFTADAHRDNGKRFIVSADEKLTAFLELERVTRDDTDRNQTAP